MKASAINNQPGVMRTRPQWVSGERLKEVYPELDSWASPLVTKAFVGWQRATGVAVDKPDRRDERFPVFLLNVMLEKHKESLHERA